MESQPSEQAGKNQQKPKKEGDNPESAATDAKDTSKDTDKGKASQAKDKKPQGKKNKSG